MMKITISLSNPAEVETESLVAVVLDSAEAPLRSADKDKKPDLKVASADSAIQSVSADLLTSGELSGKPFETDLLHKPNGLKAKRLLLVSGGPAKKFSSLRSAAHCRSRCPLSEIPRHSQFRFRCAAGNSRQTKPFAPSSKAHTSGTLIPTTTAAIAKTRRLTLSPSSPAATKPALRKRPNEAQVIGESQNFTRDLVNEPRTA